MESSVECKRVNRHHPQGMIVWVIMKHGEEKTSPIVILSAAKNPHVPGCMLWASANSSLRSE
jgi:hypothetical protein